GMMALGPSTRLVGQVSPVAKFIPDQWPKEDLARYLALQNGIDPQTGKRLETQRSAVGSRLSENRHVFRHHAASSTRVPLRRSSDPSAGSASVLWEFQFCSFY